MTKIQSYGVIAGIVGVALIAFGVYMSEVPADLPSVMAASYPDAKLWCVALGVFVIAGGALLGVFGKHRT